MGAMSARDKYYYKLPVWAGGNYYFNGAKPMSSEKDAVVDGEHTITVSLAFEEGKPCLVTNVYDYVDRPGTLVSSETLGMAFEPEERFENPDGTSILFDVDYFGRKRPLRPLAGPFREGEEVGEELV